MKEGAELKRNGSKLHNTFHLAATQQISISWLLCTHLTFSADPDRIHSSSGKHGLLDSLQHNSCEVSKAVRPSLGLLFQKEFKVGCLFLFSNLSNSFRNTCSFIFLFLCKFCLSFVFFDPPSRIDELRHRLIPLYTYDPAEEEEEVWSGADGGNEDKELVVSKELCLY